MPRLIDADALYKVFMEELERYPMPETPGLGRYRAQVWREAAGFFITMLMKARTIDAKPARHGRWVDRYDGKYANPLYECSECKEKALYKYEVDVLDNGHFVQALSNACPHCRAKMDGGGDK